MKTNWFAISLVGCLALCLTACSQVTTPTFIDDDAQAEPATSFPTQEPEMDDAQADQPTPISGMESLIEKAKEDLAQQLSIPIAQINLVKADEVVWPDASLGCPQPGMKYKQVPEDGALIILQAEGKVYEYHTGGSRGLFLCEKVLKDPYTPSQIDITKLTPAPLDKNNLPPTLPDNGIPPGEDQ
jgi:hypothetical protein